jgi:hypothetical protein
MLNQISDKLSDDAQALSPEQAGMYRRMRWLMLVSGLATFLGIAVVFGVIGYRVFRGDGSLAPPELTAMLPKGAKIVSTALAGDRIVVTIEAAGSLEIRTFDAHSLKPAGRLRFANEP